MKTNLEYYPHYRNSHSHPKFKLLRAIFGEGDKGWAAEGRFWALNNIISSKTNCELDLTKKRDKADAAEVLGLSLEKFDNFIETLVDPEIELILEIQPGIYTTKILQETYQIVSDEREKARVRKEKNKNKNNSGELAKNSGELNNKEEEKKYKTKGEENSFIPTLQQVISFFNENGASEYQALKFFNHFESKSWKNINNWKPRALNWIAEDLEKTNTTGNYSFEYYVGKEFEEMINNREGLNCSKETRQKYYQNYDCYYIEGIEKGCWVKKEIAKSKGLILFKDKNKIFENVVFDLPIPQG